MTQASEILSLRGRRVILFECPECGTKKKYPDDRAGDRVSCRICGKKATLPGSDDDDDNGCDGEPRKKSKRGRGKPDPKAELIAFTYAGWIVSGISCLLILFAFERRPLIPTALLAGFPIGWVIIGVYGSLVGMGFRAAIGKGLTLSRETKLEGKSGVQAGIGIVMTVAVLTVLGMELLGETGKAPTRPSVEISR